MRVLPIFMFSFHTVIFFESLWIFDCPNHNIYLCANLSVGRNNKLIDNTDNNVVLTLSLQYAKLTPQYYKQK